MFYKISKISFIILMFILLTNSAIFLQVAFADETEMYNNKPVFARLVVEWEYDITNLEELENNSKLIIKGIVQPDKEVFMSNNTPCFTKTTVLVKEVLKGDKDLLNQTITCLEPYYEITKDGVSGYIISGNYYPAIENTEYVLFLNNYDSNNELYKNVYTISYYEKGKYLIDNYTEKTRSNIDNFVDGLTNKELNIGPKNGADEVVYRDIYKSVMEKYVLNSYTETTESVTETEKFAVTEQITEETTAQETTQIVSKTTVTKTADELGAIIKNDRILIPLRDTAEIMDCIVGWAPDTKTAYLIKDKNTVKFTINSSEYSVNDNVFALDTPAEIYNDKTYIPLRALSEGLGIEIEYNSSDKTVTLTY